MTSPVAAGSRKEFVDLFCLLRQFSLLEMLGFHEQRYDDHDPFPVVKSPSYFDDAEGEPDPMMLEAVSWEAVKERVGDSSEKMR